MVSVKRKRTKGDAGAIERSLAKLRQLIQTVSDLSQVFEFMEHDVGCETALKTLGSMKDHPILASVVKVAVNSHSAVGRCHQDRFVHVPEYHMWHGCLFFDPGVAVIVVYFEDINRCFAMSTSVADWKTHFFRFSIPEEMTEPIDVDDVVLASVHRRSTEPSAPN